MKSWIRIRINFFPTHLSQLFLVMCLPLLLQQAVDLAPAAVKLTRKLRLHWQWPEEQGNLGQGEKEDKSWQALYPSLPYIQVYLISRRTWYPGLPDIQGFLISRRNWDWYPGVPYIQAYLITRRNWLISRRTWYPGVTDWYPGVTDWYPGYLISRQASYLGEPDIQACQICSGSWYPGLPSIQTYMISRRT